MTRSSLVPRAFVLGGLLLALVWSAKSGSDRKYPEPEDSAVANGAFQSDYFGLRYPLPDGWVEDLKGPEPSTSGFYSLAALKPAGELVATMQISAQDNFFAPGPVDAMSFLEDMKQHLDSSLSAPETVASTEFGGLHFARLDYSGAGLQHAVFATEIRCHTVTFAITSQRKETIANLSQSLKRLSSLQAKQDGRPTQAARSKPEWPVCVNESDYRGHIARRATPAMTGPRFASVPVRLTIGTDGKIEHIHAIAGFPEQIQSVSDALSRWEFTPYIVSGAAVEVETGILFQFPQTKPDTAQ